MFTLLPNAAERIKELNQKNGTQKMLRIQVQRGGCSGFEYVFKMDDQQMKDDHIFEENGAKVIIDEISYSFLNEAELDFCDDLTGSFFMINTPNTKKNCSCGNSFFLETEDTPVKVKTTVRD
jgi:iron-sulfur cluster insertion protein